MPGPLEASFDVQVAEYLQWLFGARAAERRTALRVAQERVDQQRAESASSISVGTLRALAIDHRDNTGSGSLRRSNPIISVLASRATPTPVPAPQGHGKHALMALVGALVVVCGGLLLQLSRGPSSTHQAAPFGPLPAESFGQPVPRATVSQQPRACQLRGNRCRLPSPARTKRATTAARKNGRYCASARLRMACACPRQASR